MAIEGLPVSGPSPTGAGGASSASAAGAGSTASEGSGSTDFTRALANAQVSASPAGSGESSTSDPTVSSDDGDTLEDEIGFEDLSEFLLQIVPGATPPPVSTPTNSEMTLELEFSGDSNNRSENLTSLLGALSADSRGKSDLLAGKDSFMAADLSLLRDALAAEAVSASMSPDSMSFADASLSSLDSSSAQVTFSPLHAALQPAHTISQSTVASEQIRSSVGTQQWADELGTQLTWMAQQGRESASLTLSPEHLGPIEVRISVQDGAASVWFGAQQADTRSALEQAMPRLRELFSAQGLSLADSGVFREAPRQQPQPFSDASRGGSNSDEVQVVNAVTKRGSGILDLYA